MRPIQQSQSSNEEDLRRLIERSRGGDTEAFRGLYESFAPRIYTYAYYRLGDAESARDAVQDVLVAVWERLPAFEERHPGSFPAWVFRIARNTTVDALRRGRALRSVPLDSLVEGGVEFEGTTVDQRLVVQLLAGLPALQREVVVLRFLVGMSLAEVAAALGKRVGAIEQLQLRAVRRLRRELGRD